MAFVATLIANPSNPVLSPALAEQAAEAVKASGLYWLADGVACDLALRDGSDLSAAEATILAAIGNLPVDLVVQDAETRRKKLLIADMDSTMIGQECIDELAAEVGLKEKVAAITARGWSLCGEWPQSGSSSNCACGTRRAMPRTCSSVPYSSSTPWMASSGQRIAASSLSIDQSRNAGESQTSFQPRKAESTSSW